MSAEMHILELWEQKIEELKGPRTKKHVYQETAAEMEKQGYQVISTAIKMKLDNLTEKYRKCKTTIETSGGSPNEWPLHTNVHRIIGGFIINNVEELVEERCVEFSNENLTTPSSSPAVSPPTNVFPGLSSSSSPALKRSAKRKGSEQLVSVCEKNGEQFLNSNEHLLRYNVQITASGKGKVESSPGDAKICKTID